MFDVVMIALGLGLPAFRERQQASQYGGCRVRRSNHLQVARHNPGTPDTCFAGAPFRTEL